MDHDLVLRLDDPQFPQLLLSGKPYAISDPFLSICTVMPVPLFIIHIRNEPRSYSIYLFRTQNVNTSNFKKLIVTLSR